MGLSRSIHLGPFVKIPVQYKEIDNVSYGCGEHTFHRDYKFCPTCGKEGINIRSKDKQMVWPEDLIGSERMYKYVEGETMYLLSNVFLLTDIDAEENKFETLDHNRIIDMLQEFSSKFKEEIKTLEERIGQKVTVEFGFVYILQ